MKHGIFISYSDLDRHKVELFERELKENKNFYPIIIAFNRDPLKPLAQKVADGIIKSEIVVPILTNNSIYTQWINQEIGFATALNKKIMPIVDYSLTDKLKGFIHKQIDLPYGYNTNSTKAQENKEFVKQVKNLLIDLDKVYNSLISVDIPVQKTDFEKSLNQADKLNEEINFQTFRKQFLSSHEGIKAANNEITKIFNELEAKLLQLKEKNIHCATEKSVQHPQTFIIKCDGFSFSIAWSQENNNLIDGAILYVRHWKGYLTMNSPGQYPPSERPEMVSDNQFLFDINKQKEILWKDKTYSKFYTSSQIVDSNFKWLIDQISTKKLEERN